MALSGVGIITVCRCVCQLARETCACMVDGSTAAALCAVWYHLDVNVDPLSLWIRLSMFILVWTHQPVSHRTFKGEGRRATQDTHNVCLLFYLLPRGGHCAVLAFASAFSRSIDPDLSVLTRPFVPSTTTGSSRVLLCHKLTFFNFSRCPCPCPCFDVQQLSSVTTMNVRVATSSISTLNTRRLGG